MPTLGNDEDKLVRRCGPQQYIKKEGNTCFKIYMIIPLILLDFLRTHVFLNFLVQFEG